MKYLCQFFVILLISFIGELLSCFIPLPVPASIYGLLLMLLLLCTGALRLDRVEKTADFLIEIMPVMFIPAGVGIVTAWADLKPVIVPVAVITLVSTVVVMAVTGKTAEIAANYTDKRRNKNERDT